MILPLNYYLNEDVLFLGKDLLGKFLMTKIGNVITGGMIIETESYRAPEDKASHAYQNKKTKRNAMMFEKGGIAYVYRCYGIHALFNVVTNHKDIPHAILIRAIKPMIGIDEILKRRKKEKVNKTLCGGPGTLTEALGITCQHNGLSLQGPLIWIEDKGVKVTSVMTTPRIGVDYAEEDALLPWRFLLKD